MADQGNTDSPRKTVSHDVVEAVNLLAQGKRNYMCGEVGHAVNQLHEACRLLCAQYGEVANECGDAYFWYGKALLEVARQEGGILGDAVPGANSEASSQESKDDDDDDDEETADGNSSVNDVDGAGDGEDDGAQSEDIENEEADEDSAAAVASNTETKSDAAPISDEAVAKTDAETNMPSSSADVDKPKDSESAEEDVSNLQLAWEMLECAKLIYKRNDAAEMQLKLAEAYLKLGEIGMETEQYDQAISDLTDCLSIQQSLLSADDRRVAETRYQLGLACTFDKRYEPAITHYHAAISVIEAKMKQLAQVVSGEIPPSADVDPHGFDTPQQLAQKEMDELASIVPDIVAKIEDVEDERRNADRVMLAMRDNLVQPGCSSQFSSFPSESTGFASSSLPSTSSSSAAASAQPIHNISHLVRKKRKSEEESSDAPKRCKLTTVPAAAAGDVSNDLTSNKQPPVGNSLLQNGDVDTEHGRE